MTDEPKPVTDEEIARRPDGPHPDVFVDRLIARINAEKERADAAEQQAERIAELTDALRHAVDELNHYGHLNNSQTGEPTPASHIYAKALRHD